MNAQQFNKIIAEPVIIKEVLKDDIASLILQYPYCQSLHLIYLKKLHLDQHLDYNTFLARTAAYANDRKALYKLIYHTAEEQIKASGITAKQKIEFAPEAYIDLQSETTAELPTENGVVEIDHNENIDFEKPIAEDLLIALEKENAEKEAIEIQNELIMNEILLIHDADVGGVEENKVFEDIEEDEILVDEHLDPEVSSMHELENELSLQALNESLKNIEVEMLSKATSVLDDVDEEDEVFEMISDPEMESNLILEEEVESLYLHNIESDREPETNSSAIIIEEPFEVVNENINESASLVKNIPITEEKSFNEWLKLFSTGSVQKVEPTNRNLPKENAESKIIVENKKIQSNESVVPNKIEADTDSKVLDEILNLELQSQNYLFNKIPNEIIQEIKSIDDFVVESHQQKPIIKTFKQVSVADLAKRSLEEGDEILTETMARILSKQGKHKRAIDIVEKLMLNNPDKRIYFAALLEEIKNKTS